MSHPPGADTRTRTSATRCSARSSSRSRGSRFRDYVSDEILKPLGMASSVWEAGGRAAGATGHRVLEDQHGDGRPSRGRPTACSMPPVGSTPRCTTTRATLRSIWRPIPRATIEPETGPVRRSTLREMHRGAALERAGNDYDAPVAQRDPGRDCAARGQLWLRAGSRSPVAARNACSTAGTSRAISRRWCCLPAPRRRRSSCFSTTGPRAGEARCSRC